MVKKCPQGKVLRGNKCITKKGIFNFEYIKSNNPLKMIGSWIGAVLGIILSSFIPFLQGNFPDSTFDDFSLWKVITESLNLTSLGWFKLVGYTILSSIIGFILGYIIHILVRKSYGK